MFGYLNRLVDTIGQRFITAELDVRHSPTAMLATRMDKYDHDDDDYLQLPSKITSGSTGTSR